MCFHFDQEDCFPRCNPLPQYLDGCYQNIRAGVKCPHQRCLSTLTNPPLTAFNNDWLSHKYSYGSSINVPRSAGKTAANSGRFQLEPSSSRPILHCDCCSLRACLFLCPSSVCVLFFLIALDIHVFLQILSCFLQSCFSLVCHVAILVNPTQSIFSAHYTFDVALSPPRFPARSLSFASFPICLLSCCDLCLLATV